MACQISARACDRAVSRKRPWPRPETRRERRRHVVKRRPAIAAGFLWRSLHAHPVPTRGTFRVQALHGPAGEILHAPASQTIWAEGGRISTRAALRVFQATNALKNCANFAPEPSSVSRKIYTISRGSIAGADRRAARSNSTGIIYFEAPGCLPFAASSLACRSSNSVCAAAASCCFASTWSFSAFRAAAPAVSEA